MTDPYAQNNGAQQAQPPVESARHDSGPPQFAAQQPYDPAQQTAQPPFGSPGAAPSYPGQQPQQQVPTRPATDENGVRFGIGPFTLREVILVALSLIVFIASFLPVTAGDFADFVGYQSLWAPSTWLVIPGALVLLAAAALIVIRRLSPGTALRVGSLSVDQFASVAAIMTAGFHAGFLFLLIGLGSWLNNGSSAIITPGAGVVVALLASLGTVVVTTFATVIPYFMQEFAVRPVTPAHLTARPAIPVPVRARPVAQPFPVQYSQPGYPSAPGTQGQPAQGYQTQAYPAQGFPVGAGYPAPQSDPNYAQPQAPEQQPVVEAAEQYHAQQQEAFAQPQPAPVIEAAESVEASEIITEPASEPKLEAPVLDELDQQTIIRRVDANDNEAAVPDSAEETPVEAHPSGPPFWVYSTVPRGVVDENTGATVFEIGPAAWALAIVDRGHELVIRHDDGRVGVLRETGGLMRG